jgi:Flp pilus assembly pilin Flp
MKTTKIETTTKTLKTKKTIRRRRGQGMTEYIVIVGLIAIVLIPAIGMFKKALDKSFRSASKKVDDQITRPMEQVGAGGNGSGDGSGDAGSGGSSSTPSGT